MKKIAFITPHYYPSILTGSGVVVMKLAEELAKLGYDVSLITSNALTVRYWYDPIFGKKIEKKYEVHNKVKIYRLSCYQLYSSTCFILLKFLCNFLPKKLIDYIKIMSSGPYLIGLDKILASNNYDIIHCSPSPLAINKQVVAVLSKMREKPKLIITPFFHSQLSDFANPQLKKIFQSADFIHVITDIEKVEIHTKFLINVKKIIVIPLFLDIFNMHTADYLKKDVIFFKEKYNLGNKKIILFAGIKGFGKGAIDLLLAINMLHKTNPEYILIAIGTGTPEWNNAKTKIDKDCLLDFEYKTGKEKEIIFASCDVFCLPSKSESFGLVYLEAWHKEKPVIAADIPAVREFIDKDGVFIEFGNKEQIIEAIIKLTTEKSMASSLGKQGNSKLISKYTFSKIFPKYISMFSNN
ncbi:MAG: glycosyltransferase family 4 protein [Candidatus Parcubacteria bacterium]|nr:glycosyltransferase family 4 protein [Candidatus Parcubacteria bacterium]